MKRIKSMNIVYPEREYKGSTNERNLTVWHYTFEDGEHIETTDYDLIQSCNAQIKKQFDERPQVVEHRGNKQSDGTYQLYPSSMANYNMVGDHAATVISPEIATDFTAGGTTIREVLDIAPDLFKKQ